MSNMYGLEEIDMQEVCFENCGEGRGCQENAAESRLMMMTFIAHKEILFEKIKQKIEEKEGKKLEKVADLIVEAAYDRWKSSSESERRQGDFGDKIRKAFEE